MAKGSGKKGGKKSANPPLHYRDIPSIVIKRKHIDLSADDKYGHWWFEIDGKESYGWWPKKPVSIKATVIGVEGNLNGAFSFNGTATKDPHHGDSADEEFYPRVAISDSRTEAEIKDCLRQFANSYSGNWSWPLGQNCHSFQEAALRHCKLTI